jgi:hypothetical protein
VFHQRLDREKVGGEAREGFLPKRGGPELKVVLLLALFGRTTQDDNESCVISRKLGTSVRSWVSLIMGKLRSTIMRPGIGMYDTGGLCAEM